MIKNYKNNKFYSGTCLQPHLSTSQLPQYHPDYNHSFK